jgi:hypothetical protein
MLFISSGVKISKTSLFGQQNIMQFMQKTMNEKYFNPG